MAVSFPFHRQRPTVTPDSMTRHFTSKPADPNGRDLAQDAGRCDRDQIDLFNTVSPMTAASTSTNIAPQVRRATGGDGQKSVGVCINGGVMINGNGAHVRWVSIAEEDR
jgi:hypothetical protein